MSPDPTPDPAVPASGATPPDPSATGGTPTPDPTPTPDALGEAGKKALDQERQARRDAEKQLKEAQDRIRAFEDQGRTELEKAQGRQSELEKRNSDLERQLQEHTLRSAVITEAMKAGALYPEDVWRLLDLASIEFESDGTPKNLEKHVKSLRDSRPALFRANGQFGSGDGGARPGATPGGDMNSLIRQAAGRA